MSQPVRLAESRRARAAARRARRRRRQRRTAGAALLVPIALTGWGIGQQARQGTAPVGALAADLLGPPGRTFGARPPVMPVPTRALPIPAGPQGEGPGPTSYVQRGSGRLTIVPGQTRQPASGSVVRYTVEVEEGIGEDPDAFSRAVDRVLADPRSWGAGGRLALVRVPGTDPELVDIRVTLVSPDTTDELCAPLDTGGEYSCRQGDRAVINGMRWRLGAAAYAEDLAGYRAYVVNHEVGHALGRGHESCPRRGGAAPVMMQQTVGVGSCRANPWPYP